MSLNNQYPWGECDISLNSLLTFKSEYVNPKWQVYHYPSLSPSLFPSLIINTLRTVFKCALYLAYSWILLNSTFVKKYQNAFEILNSLKSFIFPLKTSEPKDSSVEFYKKGISNDFNMQIHLLKNDFCFYNSR